MKCQTLALLAALLPGFVWASGPRVEMQTNLGNIVVELEADKAPKTVANFLSYVDDGSYNHSLFHRVIPGFVAQGGGYNSDFTPLPTHNPVENESNNGLSNRRGTLAMARMSDPNSATRQFYFNLNDNLSLDANVQPGYTVFGTVVSGMDVLEKIADEPTTVDPKLRASDVPTDPIVITKVTRLN
ncbi:peptidylprolyl isomerase [Tolumonas lignilytica]|jgi:Peptidyl-prolyl cis-trans isomerase (rotamase) - cyclophilin family|uniref:peptidylprolyl isomerase n=1 Tax=Tolumonas lignilytica TaxID=1283284 RepID=UPI00046604D4|nr:peptidylprolyl isomerase [Tolumonas lignilytica]